MIKMILCDMDGTLLDDERKLPPDFDEIMGILKERGVLFVPASGRQYTAIVNQMPQYKDDFAFVSENGAIAMYKGESVFSSPISPGAVRKLLRRTAKHSNIYPVLCGKQKVYVEEKWRPYLSELTEFLNEYEFVDSLMEMTRREEIIKIAFADCESSRAEETLLPVIQESAPQGMKVVLSSSYWVDVLNDGVHKGTALRHLMVRFNIRRDECAAFGDYINDIEMLKTVKYGYAVANAHPEVIKAVNLFAPANNKNGVMRTIRRLIEVGLV